MLMDSLDILLDERRIQRIQVIEVAVVDETPSSDIFSGPIQTLKNIVKGILL
jgi:hypothetical protein